MYVLPDGTITKCFMISPFFLGLVYDKAHKKGKLPNIPEEIRSKILEFL
jgi:hypothetical protein